MKILQFGTGRFLRGFFDPIIESVDSIAVVQSRATADGAKLINQARDGYHVWTRGKLNGEIIDDVQQVHSLGQAIIAANDWRQICELAIDAKLKLVVSNTTEMGLRLDDDDRSYDVGSNEGCPVSFPAKLVDLLFKRFTKGCGGLTVLPLELIEFNAKRLYELVLEQAQQWKLTRDENFLGWLETENRWLSNLVDRICVGVNVDPPWPEHDPLAVIAEPFRMLAIQDDGGDRNVLPAHPMIEWVDDLRPKFLRKVRILNGLHTAMVARSLPRGCETVLDVMNNPDERTWIGELLNDEILPTLEQQGLQEQDFAKQVLERFENPFFKHFLKDIAANHATKLQTRIEPTFEEYVAAFGKQPDKLSEVLASTS